MMFMIIYISKWASLVAQMLKNLPAMQETWVRSLGQKDPLESGMDPHQYSCLENFIYRGAWQATVHWGHKELDTSLNSYTLYIIFKKIQKVPFYLLATQESFQKN